MKLKLLILLLITIIILFQALEKECRGVIHVGASPYNSNWDGTALLIKMYDEFYGSTIIVSSWFSLYLRTHDEDSCKVLLIVSPEKEYTPLEKFIIYRLVYDKGYNIVILDEGPYSNELLSYLNVPIAIKGYNYVKDGSGSPIVQGKILLNNISIQLLFAYVSPIIIFNENVCKPIAFINTTTVGAMCSKDNRTFLVIGDGSIVTNSVIAYESILNPYTILSKYIISSTCNSDKKVVIYVDSTKYRVRLATIEELIEQGYDYRNILSILLNPSRYIFVFLTYINENINENLALYLIPPIFILTAILFNKLFLKEGSKQYNQLKPLEENTYNRRNIDNVINIICSLEEFKVGKKHEAICKCLSRSFKKSKCLTELKNIINKDKELKKHILRTLSMTH